MVLKRKGARAVAKHDWRSEPEDPPVRPIESVRSSEIAARQLAQAAETLPPPPDTEPDALMPGIPDAAPTEPGLGERSVSGVRQKHVSEMAPAATVDEVTADLRKDFRRE